MLLFENDTIGEVFNLEEDSLAAVIYGDYTKVREGSDVRSTGKLMAVPVGQRELIIGDRKTGKTAIALDAIINQKGKNVICVYVAVGQKDSTIAEVIETLRRFGAMD